MCDSAVHGMISLYGKPHVTLEKDKILDFLNLSNDGKIFVSNVSVSPPPPSELFW